MDQQSVLMIAAVLCVVLIGGMVFMLLEIQKALSEGKEALKAIRIEVSPVFKELREAAECVHAIAREAQASFQHSTVLLHALGDLGEYFQKLQEEMRGKSKGWITNLLVIGAGLRTAATVFQKQTQKENLQDLSHKASETIHKAGEAIHSAV